MTEFVELRPAVSRFPQLVESRREWIEQVLQPWCRTASCADLLLAEQAWLDLAGQPDVEKTLWLWAWQRFPALHEEGLTAINETYLVEIRLRSGNMISGFPDARASTHGTLVLLSDAGLHQQACLIDDVIDVKRSTLH